MAVKDLGGLGLFGYVGNLINPSTAIKVCPDFIIYSYESLTHNTELSSLSLQLDLTQFSYRVIYTPIFIGDYIKLKHPLTVKFLNRIKQFKVIQKGHYGT